MFLVPFDLCGLSLGVVGSYCVFSRGAISGTFRSVGAVRSIRQRCDLDFGNKKCLSDRKEIDNGEVLKMPRKSVAESKRGSFELASFAEPVSCKLLLAS
jgi:hypothetical protein